MLVYTSHEHALNYAQVAFIMFTWVIYTVIWVIRTLKFSCMRPNVLSVLNTCHTVVRILNQVRSVLSLPETSEQSFSEL